MAKVILIDPFTKTITAGVIGPEIRINTIIGGPLGYTRLGKNGDVIFYDDDALVRQQHTAGFRLQGFQDPILGKVLVTGPEDDDGNETDTTFTVETITSMVEFLGEIAPWKPKIEVLAF